MSNPKEWLELRLIYHFRLNRGKEDFGFWARDASYGKVTRTGMVNKGCLVRFVMQF